MKACSFCGCINGENNLNCHQCGRLLFQAPDISEPVCEEMEASGSSLLEFGVFALFAFSLLCLFLLHSAIENIEDLEI